MRTNAARFGQSVVSRPKSRSPLGEAAAPKCAIRVSNHSKAMTKVPDFETQRAEVGGQRTEVGRTAATCCLLSTTRLD